MTGMCKVEEFLLTKIKSETNHNDIKPETRISTIQLDSISFVSLLIEIEKYLDIQFSNELPLLSNCITIHDITESVCRLLAKNKVEANDEQS